MQVSNKNNKEYAEKLYKERKGEKVRLGRLKRKAEKQYMPHSSDLLLARIRKSEDRLAKIDADLKTCGERPTLSRTEQRNENFRNSADNICRLIFITENGNSLPHVHSIAAHGNFAIIEASRFCESPTAKTVPREELIENLKEISFGSWKRFYSQQALFADGFCWSVEIVRTNGKHSLYSGENAFPYDLCALIELFDPLAVFCQKYIQ